MKLFICLNHLICVNQLGGNNLDENIVIQKARDGCKDSFAQLIKSRGEK